MLVCRVRLFPKKSAGCFYDKGEVKENIVRKIVDFLGGGKEKRNFYVFLAVVAVFTALLMLMTFEHEDVDSLAAWSFNFWDLFFKGRLDEFYSYTAQNIHGAAHKNCGGNYLFLLPLCIWNLPLWVVQTVSGALQTANFFSICWTKLFFLLLHAVTAYFSAKICTVISSDQNKAVLTMLLVMASPEILLSVGYTGQDEITYVALFVIAFYSFLKGYWKRCYAFMVCCVTLCPIMIIPVLAILLIREKRILRLVFYLLGTVLPLAAFEVLYRKDPVYQEVKHINDFTRMMRDMLSGSVLSTSWGTFSVAGIILCAVYFYCYFEHLPEKKDEYNKAAAYIVTLIFVIISFGMVNDYYRMFLYVPFFIIVIMTSGQDMGTNLLLFTGMTYGRTFQAIGDNYPMCLNSVYIMKHSWISALCDHLGSDKYRAGFDGSVCLWSYMIRLGDSLDFLCFLIETCVLGAVVILLIINRCHFTKRYKTDIHQDMLLAVYTFCMPFIMVCYYFMILH